MNGYHDKTVAIVGPIQANSPEKAEERARTELTASLALLRSCLSVGGALHSVQAAEGKLALSAPKMPIYALYDWQLLFRQSGEYAIKELAADRVVTVGTRFERVALVPQSMGITVTRDYSSALANLTDRLGTFLVTNHLPQYGPEFRRALEWVGSSITRETADDKVIDLCTALECFLTSKGDGRKGEAIATRYVVLAGAVGGLYTHPIDIYNSYLLRSAVVHGSDLRVCTDKHYDMLIRVTMRALCNAEELCSREDIRRATSLIRYLDGQPVMLRHLQARIAPFSHDKRYADFISYVDAKLQASVGVAQAVSAPH